MAKDIKRGDDYLVYLNTGTFVSKTWALVKQAVNPGFDPAFADIVVQEAQLPDGHLHGYGDPVISFDLNEDTGDANNTAIIAASETMNAMKEFAIANGPIATPGTIHRSFEALITAGALTAARGGPAARPIELRRHANSENGITKTTVA